jgi:hypothetical protein
MARVHVLVLLLTAAALGACESPRAPSAERPQDFALHVVVYPPTDDLRPPRPAPPSLGRQRFEGLDQPRPEDDLVLPRWQRPSTFIIEPGGRLRAAFGPAVVQGQFPPLARQLWPGEADEVYGWLRDAGLLEIDAPGRISSAEAFEPPASHGGIAVFDIVSDRWTRVRRFDYGTGEAAERARQIVDRLAAMTWQPE